MENIKRLHILSPGLVSLSVVFISNFRKIFFILICYYLRQDEETILTLCLTSFPEIYFSRKISPCICIQCNPRHKFSIPPRVQK